MKLSIYVSPEIVIKNEFLLERVCSNFDMHSVILRSADAEAVKIVRKFGLQVYWLAPGLWGNINPKEEEQAHFKEVLGWKDNPAEAFEAKWPMLCPSEPSLPLTLAREYADISQSIDVDGIYCTHMRYHHPADIRQLWGCNCKKCRKSMGEYGFSFEEVQHFWGLLKKQLNERSITNEKFSKNNNLTGAQSLIKWWVALTESEVPVRFFQWKNESMETLITSLKSEYTNISNNKVFSINSFEPILGDLVGHLPSTSKNSLWYSPLLGYWPNHVWQSVFNIASWHADLSNQNIDTFLPIIRTILSDQGYVDNPGLAVSHELKKGASIAKEINREYWPVLNGTTSSVVPLSKTLKWAEEVKADGVVLQGISQLLHDPTVDFWY